GRQHDGGVGRGLVPRDRRGARIAAVLAEDTVVTDLHAVAARPAALLGYTRGEHQFAGDAPPYASAVDRTQEPLHVLGGDQRTPVTASHGRDRVDVGAPRISRCCGRQIAGGDIAVDLVHGQVAARAHARRPEHPRLDGPPERHPGDLREEYAEEHVAGVAVVVLLPRRAQRWQVTEEGQQCHVV